MVFPFCNKFSQKHEDNIQLTENAETAQWIDNRSNLFRAPIGAQRLFNFTYTGSGHFKIGLNNWKDTERLETKIECKREKNGKGAIVITSYGRLSIINGMKEILNKMIELDEHLYLFFDIKFGDIKIKPEDFALQSDSENCNLLNGVAFLRNHRPLTLCSREKPFKPNDKIQLTVKKNDNVSYWCMELLVTSAENTSDLVSIQKLESKEGQYTYEMNENYEVIHNGSVIFRPQENAQGKLNLWFKIFRAEVSMQTLGERDENGHYNRDGKSPSDVNPNNTPSSTSSTRLQSMNQTCVKQPF